MTRRKQLKIESWHFMLLTIAISLVYFVAGEIRTYVQKRELVELQLKVIILKRQLEIGELKNRVLELELDLD